MAYRIPIINQNERFLDINEEPLVNGKVEVLDPVSNNALTIWSYADDEYTVMTNPVILDVEGRCEQTVFCDRIVYCRVYKYLGLDENSHPIYEFVRDYYTGSNDNTESREYVVGIEDLKDLDPSVNSSVNVLGYYNAYDCPMRQYVWDANCTQDPDGGYIIASDVSATGRWILVFSGEYLPSSYYGVYPGKVANINAFTSYIAAVGTALTPTAPGIWFVPGTYDIETNINTEKRVLLDSNTCFLCNYFYCGHLTVKGTPSSNICDFDFRDSEQEAHSSWFKTIAGFLTCGAKKFVFDSKDNFLNKTLQNTNYTLTNKIIEGQTRLPVTYPGSNARITFSNCAINAERIFNSTDQLGFAYTDIHDNWWINPAEIDFNTKVYARSTSLNRIELDNFTNANAYVNAKTADGATFIDLAGRNIYNIALTGSVIELRNAYVDNQLTISKSGVDIWLKHVKCGNVYVTSRYLTIEDNCNLTMSEPSCSAIWMNDSTIYGSSMWTNKNCQIRANNCFIGFGLNWATENDLDTAYLEFINCKFQENVSFYVKRITMQNCITSNNTIKIYPHKSDNVYWIGSVVLQNNVFNNNNPIEFTKVDVINGWAQDDVYECMVQWTITGNQFNGNTEGLRCRFWQHRTGSNYEKTFIKRCVQNIVYSGNTGNCPAEDMRNCQATSYSDSGWTKIAVPMISGGTTFDFYKYSSGWKRVMPIQSQDSNSYTESWKEYQIYTTVKGNTMIKYSSWRSEIDDHLDKMYLNLFIEPNAGIYHSDMDNHIADGDFFKMAICVRDRRIMIEQPNHLSQGGDRTNGVVGKYI